MEKQQALTLLGLPENYSAADVVNAVTTKKQQLQQKRNAAPTDVLKAKFDQLLAQVAAAEALLQTASVSAKSNPSLSHTKLADLPSMAPGDAEQLALQPGQVLAGRYEIKNMLGQGGMGAVYRAYDKNRAEDIAIKLLLPSLTRNDTARERFVNEARLSSKLSHPNIVNVFDVQNDGDLYFLTMELLEGQDLRQVMENQTLAGRPFDIADIKHYIECISNALSEAHKVTVHRDIKPENIWLTDDGQLKLMDFGIAQVQSTSQRTKTGAAMGTAYYMAPEQLKGQKDIDGRADQYALAVLAYELLTGEVPAGVIEPVEQLRKDTPKAMAAAIMQALQSRPENRFTDMAAFNSAFQSGKAVKTQKANAASALTKNGIPLPAIVATLLVLIVGVGLVASGKVDIASLLPKSKEEIAEQKASVAKAQGEIKVYKQRLENGRRQLDSDVRDAQRNKDNNLAALQHWQQLTENGIFAGSHITELEGELSMAETLLRENAFEAAQASMDKVSAGYKKLWEEFTAAELLYEAAQKTAALNEQWQSHAASYQVYAPSQTNAAEAEQQNAKTAERSGEFSQAKNSYASAQQHWRSAFEAVAAQVAEVKQQRQQAAYIGQLVTIPAGSFSMGSNAYSLAQPIHSVSIRAFKMQAHEVTWAQYQPCIDAGACPDNSSNGGDNGWGKGTRPVIQVSWNDITQHYIPWLKSQTGQRFRLPTEAEWEYAARAGSTSDYSWGNGISCSQARYGRRSGGECSNSLDGTVPVKSFSANAFGLYDMHGNVWEWVQDCWNHSYSGAPADGSAWTSGDCGRRLRRGGSWEDNVYFLRSASRISFDPYDRSYGVGFRLVQDL